MSKRKILVTGGLGYIGSHAIVNLLQAGYEVVSLDNEINSSIRVLDGIEAITGIRVQNIHVDISDEIDSIQQVREAGQFDAIIHFAALKSVEESVYKPAFYFKNNVGGSITIMRMMDELSIPFLIFSSSCTVYGSPELLPVTEATAFGKAESPYGSTKQVSEMMFEQYFYRKSYLSDQVAAAISLRYFNPAGAHDSALIGESSLNKATNLVPVITETAIGKRERMIVYGTDYDTRDGSCMRDYIDIMDLASAHTLALQYLLNHQNEKSYEAYNLGIGDGVTVLEAINAFETATGQKVNYDLGPRRPGDVPAIYADNTLITKTLNWKPEKDIRSIMSTAWEWEKKQHRNQKAGRSDF